MKKNIGNADKIVRILLGVVIILSGIIFNSWLGLIGIIPLGTALFEFCPLYMILGVSTQKKKA